MMVSYLVLVLRLVLRLGSKTGLSHRDGDASRAASIHSFH
jgi:hypothetical protein